METKSEWSMIVVKVLLTGIAVLAGALALFKLVEHVADPSVTVNAGRLVGVLCCSGWLVFWTWAMVKSLREGFRFVADETETREGISSRP